MSLFANTELSNEEKLRLLSDYVSNHQCSNISFPFFLAAKSDFTNTTKTVLGNFLTPDEIVSVLECPLTIEMIACENVGHLESLPTNIFNPSFLRDELEQIHQNFPTINDFVNSLTPIQMPYDLHYAIIKATTHSQFGILRLRDHISKKIISVSSEKMVGANPVTTLFKTRTGKVVLFDFDKLIFLGDEWSDKAITNHANSVEKTDVFWNTTIFSH